MPWPYIPSDRHGLLRDRLYPLLRQLTQNWFFLGTVSRFGKMKRSIVISLYLFIIFVFLSWLKENNNNKIVLDYIYYNTHIY